MIDSSTTKAMDKFLGRFNNAVTRELYSKLDKDVCKKIEFSINSYSDITSFDSLKQGNSIYYVEYTKAKIPGSLAVLIPDTLIAFISDVLMGGSGEGSYKGVLSELELNATFDLLNNIFAEIEQKYNELCEDEIKFGGKPVLYSTDSQDYDGIFKTLTADMAVNSSLLFNGKTEFSLITLLNYGIITQTVAKLGLLKIEEPKKKFILDAMNVEILSDIDIDIVAELGRTRIPMKQALELTNGSMLELDSFEDSDIKIFAKGIEVAEAQIVVVGDKLGLRLTRLIPPEERHKKLK